jgi:hypothetical protein
MAELPDGRQVIGEAANEAEARRMIEQEQGRVSVSWHPERQQWSWPSRWRSPGAVPHRVIGGRLRWSLPEDE